MCGDHGFVSSMENIFTFGFKSVKLFKRLYIWNFLGNIIIIFDMLFFDNLFKKLKKKYRQNSKEQHHHFM